MQRQRLTANLSRGPKIVAIPYHSIELVVTVANVGARNHRPRAAVPVQCQRLGVGEVAYLADGPNVVAAAGCCTKDIFGRVYIGAWRHRPCAAIPMQDQCGVNITRLVPSHRPHIVAVPGNSI